MTNNEKLNQELNANVAPTDSAVKSLLGQIYYDYLNGYFENNYPTYFAWYKGMLEWLNSEVTE